MKELLASKRFQVGFTLIELLIAVALVAILVTLGAVSYSTVARNSRNADRKADFAKIRQALEEYHADHGAYPNTGGAHVTNQYWEGGGTGAGADGALQGAGRSCNTSGTGEAFCCLFGGTTAEDNKPNDPISSTCQYPFNRYLLESDMDNRYDPLFATDHNPFTNVYLYASDGQTYVLVTRRYEGLPSDQNERFTRANEPFYYCEFKDENPTFDWDSQYYVRSDNRRVPTDAEKAAKPGWPTCT